MPHAWPENPGFPDCHDDELDINAAAARACCGRSTLIDAISRGQVQIRRMGRRVFVKIASLRQWIKKRDR